MLRNRVIKGISLFSLALIFFKAIYGHIKSIDFYGEYHSHDGKEELILYPNHHYYHRYMESEHEGKYQYLETENSWFFKSHTLRMYEWVNYRDFFEKSQDTTTHTIWVDGDQIKLIIDVQPTYMKRLRF